MRDFPLDQFSAKRALVTTGFVYASALAGFVALSRLVGERWWPISLALYLPPAIWLLPLLVLIPVALHLCRPMLGIFALCLGLIIFVFTGFRFGLGTRHPKPDRKTLTVMTNNIGQSNHLSMGGFVQQQNPDLIVLQDAAGRSSYYRRTYPDRAVASVGEFVLISRFPILSAKAVSGIGPERRRPAAAVFEVSWPEGMFSLYAVHLPTPRPDFLQLTGRGLLGDAVRHFGVPWARISNYSNSMHRRVELARMLSDAINKDPNPTLVAGDFNMPSWGYIHSVFTAQLTDAFEASGRGFGLTFPGVTRNPLSLFGPWLRLDCIFCNRGWTAINCTAESGRASQHRAVAATFEWGTAKKH